MINFFSHITFNSNTKLYKIDDNSWFNSWDYISDSKIYDFGFKVIPGKLIFTSEFNIISLNDFSYTVVNEKEIIIDIDVNNIGVYEFDFEFSNDLVVDNCYNSNGDLIDHFLFKDDGVVYDLNSNFSLNNQCCTNLGYSFNSNTNKCYWENNCDPKGVKIYLNSIGTDGSLFSVNNDENCVLEINFDYLLEVDANQVINQDGTPNILNSFSGSSIYMSIERLVDRQLSDYSNNSSFESPKIYDVVYETKLFDGSDLLNKLQQPNSGVKLINDNGTFINGLEDQLLNQFNLILNSESLNSNWYNFNLIIDNEILITLIKNETIKISLSLKDINFKISILIDDVKINKTCYVNHIKETIVDQSPSFELIKTVDNKKSWVGKNNPDRRIFNLKNSETNYNIKDSKLAINSKEINLNVNMSRAIELNVMEYFTNNSCMVDSFIKGFVDFITIENFNDFIVSEYIDVKSRKTLSSYPILRLFFDNYILNNNNCNVVGGGYDYDLIFNYIMTLNYDWVDLVEQVIPSTTLWGSTYKFSNTIYDTNKFVYKKYSLLSCEKPDNGLNIGYVNVEVIKKLESSIQVCDNVFINQIDDGSEFLGKIIILNNN